MSPEAQRIAIAEECGWQRSNGPHPSWFIKETDPWIDSFALPDYLNDLNAMHEAERVLTPEWQIETYYNHLDDIVNPEGVPKMRNSWAGRYAAISATAAQRAEAFLLCLGKWDDTK